MLKRRTALTLIAVTIVASPAQAAAAEDASAPIRAFNTALLAIMRAGKATPFAQRFDALAPVADRAFNMEALLQGVVGPTWASQPEADKEALRREFRVFSIASWVANFDNFTGEEFSLAPDPRALPDGALVVETRFGPPGGKPTTLSYVMRQGGGSWQAVDVLAEGTISRVAVLRSDFRRVLANGGAAALVKQLREKNAALAAQAS
jgi:phospholipid transport system substrate-binding protein